MTFDLYINSYAILWIVLLWLYFMLRAYFIKYIDIQNQGEDMVETHWWLPGRIYMHRDKMNHLRVMPLERFPHYIKSVKILSQLEHLPQQACICIVALFQAVLRFPISNKYEYNDIHQSLAVIDFISSHHSCRFTWKTECVIMVSWHTYQYTYIHIYAHIHTYVYA